MRARLGFDFSSGNMARLTVRPARKNIKAIVETADTERAGTMLIPTASLSALKFSTVIS